MQGITVRGASAAASAWQDLRGRLLRTTHWCRYPTAIAAALRRPAARLGHSGPIAGSTALATAATLSRLHHSLREGHMLRPVGGARDVGHLGAAGKPDPGLSRDVPQQAVERLNPCRPATVARVADQHEVAGMLPVRVE